MTMEKTVAPRISDKGFVDRIYKELLHSTIKKMTQFKSGQRFEQPFFQRRYTDDHKHIKR